MTASTRLRATAGSDASVLGDEIWRHGYVLPVLIGVFMGAPLVARDFETQSYRFPAAAGFLAIRVFSRQT